MFFVVAFSIESDGDDRRTVKGKRERERERERERLNFLLPSDE